MPTPRRLVPLLAGALAASLAATAGAAPRLVARPVFAPLTAADPAPCIVELENDGQSRTVVLRGRRGTPKDAARAKEAVELEVPLEPGARKRVTLVLPPGRHPRGLVELLERGQSLALAPVDFSWAEPRYPAVIVMGAAPATLLRRARTDLALSIQSAEPADLPAEPAAWPLTAHAIAWSEPRSADLTPEQARALRRLVASGRRLIVGVSPEEPDALATLGLDDLLPASIERAEGLALRVTSMRAGTRVLPPEEALLGTFGFGAIVVVPRPLDEVALESWAALLAAEPAPGDGRPPPQPERPWLLGSAFLAERALETLSPKPPFARAAILLGLFFLAAVPLDAWLTRRSLRRGRRTRFGALRYPAIVLVFTAAGFAVAEAASGGNQRTIRYDVIDVAEDGRATGRTFLYVSRGRASTAEIRVAGGALHLAEPAQESYDDPDSFSQVLRAGAEPSGATPGIGVALGGWLPVALHSRWEPDVVPRIGLSPEPCVAPSLPACDGVRLEPRAGRASCVDLELLVRAQPMPEGVLAAGDPDGEDLETDSLLSSGLRAGQVPFDLVLAFRRPFGPGVLVDGEEAATTWTFVRYQLPLVPPDRAATEVTP